MPIGYHANYRVHVHSVAHAKSMQASTRHVATSQEAQRTSASGGARMESREWYEAADTSKISQPLMCAASAARWLRG
jgi:hypothetical protein